MSAAGRVRARVHLLARAAARPRTGLGQPGQVALTFDDGPDPTWTPRVLDVLAEEGALATFFFVGQQARAHPELVDRAARAGHGIASHSHTHPDPWTLRRQALLRDYRDGRDAVEQAAGRSTSLFRPPQGHLGLDEVAAVRLLRLECWLWTHDSEDWRPGASTASVLERTEGAGDGDVVLLHDALARPPVPELADRGPTLAAVAPLLARLRARGLEPVALGRTGPCAR